MFSAILSCNLIENRLLVAYVHIGIASPYKITSTPPLLERLTFKSGEATQYR